MDWKFLLQNLYPFLGLNNFLKMKDKYLTRLKINRFEKVIMWLLPLLCNIDPIGIERDDIDLDTCKLTVISWFYLVEANIGIEVFRCWQNASSSYVRVDLPKKQSMHCCLKTSVVLALIYLFKEMIAPPRKVFIVWFYFLVIWLATLAVPQ
jgi:hypothetical protein